MNTISLPQAPEYNYNEYLLALAPHEDLQNKIGLIKKEFSEKYNAHAALYSNPHITLVNFVQFEMREESLVNRLKKIAMEYHSFKVDLKDYGSFPSHTIFINVESKQQVQNLVKELKPAQQLMTLNKENKPHFINDLHLVIARKLSPWQFENGWLEYSHRHFTGRFIANDMLLLKRPLQLQVDGSRLAGKYKITQQFEFMNLSVKTKQGKLW